MILIGIDPGKNTGFASWHCADRRFLDVCSMALHVALFEVDSLWKGAKNAGCPNSIFVIFEDCRLQKMYGGANERAGAAVLQGVGSVKRDCTIWEDFLTDRGIPHLAQRPLRHGTKWTAEYFKRTTGWQERTNSHGRDAGALVYGLNGPIVQGLHNAWRRSVASSRPDQASLG